MVDKTLEYQVVKLRVDPEKLRRATEVEVRIGLKYFVIREPCKKSYWQMVIREPVEGESDDEYLEYKEYCKGLVKGLPCTGGVKYMWVHVDD